MANEQPSTNNEQRTTNNEQRITPEEPSSARLIVTLSIGGFLSGLILVAAYLYSSPIIQENKAKALEVAALQVLPGSVTLEKLELRDGKLQHPVAQASAGEKAAPQVFAGFAKDKQLMGFAIVNGEPGFADIIEGIMG